MEGCAFPAGARRRCAAAAPRVAAGANVCWAAWAVGLAIRCVFERAVAADAEWLLGEWHGTTALKGVCRPEDAQQAVAIGFDAVWVSNHGGRQLETSPPTIHLLPRIRDAIGNDATVIVDGGVTRGTDIAKALALGADAVGLGRAFLYGLTAGGRPGVQKVASMLARELDIAMGLLGVESVARSLELLDHLHKVHPV